MKKYWIISIVFLGLIYSCEKHEDSLTPSYKDENRVAAQVDLSKPIVKKIYETYDVGILYEYDHVLDFAYVASTVAQAKKWGDVEIPQISNLFLDSLGEMPTDTVAFYHEYVNEALTFLDTTLFRYFEPGSMIAEKLPNKVLISSSIYSEADLFISSLIESESRSYGRSYGSLSSVYNEHSIVFDVNRDRLTYKPRQLMLDNFYVFLTKIMEMNNLYNDIPESFYGGKDIYYGEVMAGIYKEEMGIDDATVLNVIDKNWFYEKGFIDAVFFYNMPNGLSNLYYKDEDGKWVKVDKALKPEYKFVSGLKSDVCSYITEMLHRDASEIEAFPENIQDNMRLLLNLFTDWGIDFVGVNPELEVLK